MDEKAKMEDHLQSAAAFVEGGIQDACDDSCSICLEDFCDSNPSAVTSCKHKFHLQCIFEWCQRSSHCPMCLQPISLKDPTSQELLEAVEKERNFRVNQSHNTIFHHPTLEELEMQHLPVAAIDAELEECIIQQLAAAAAMRRAHHGSRRIQGGSTSHGRPQFLVFSTHPSATSLASVSASSPNEGEHDPVSTTSAAFQSVCPATEEQIQQHASFALTGEADRVAASRSRDNTASFAGLSNLYSIRENRSVGASSLIIQDRAGPSDFQAFSESLKSCVNAVSMRYKESISKSTRGWKERFFSRGASMAGIATVSRMMEHIDMRENSSTASPTQGISGHSFIEPSDARVSDTHSNFVATDIKPSTSCAISSGSN